MKPPYPDEIYFAKEINEFHYDGDRNFLPGAIRQGAIYTYPKAQVLVILSEYDPLITPLGYKILESTTFLKPKGLYQSIPQFEEPLYGLGKIAEHRLKDAVRR